MLQPEPSVSLCLYLASQRTGYGDACVGPCPPASQCFQAAASQRGAKCLGDNPTAAGSTRTATVGEMLKASTQAPLKASPPGPTASRRGGPGAPSPAPLSPQLQVGLGQRGFGAVCVSWENGDRVGRGQDFPDDFAVFFHLDLIQNYWAS